MDVSGAERKREREREEQIESELHVEQQLKQWWRVIIFVFIIIINICKVRWVHKDAYRVTSQDIEYTVESL